jgi:aminoglycoside phosphotransferase family enzyme
MPDLADKLTFLQRSEAYGAGAQRPQCIETHMSWVFLVGDRVYKLKKPVRFPFLDFTTLAAREFYCREEVRLNRRLAPGVYLGLMALQWHDGVFELRPEELAPANTPDDTVDWLVCMRRLPGDRMLDQLIAHGHVAPREIDTLVAVLGAFYRSAPAVALSPDDYLARFQYEQAANREVLLRPQFHLTDAALAMDRLDQALAQHAGLLRERALSRRVLDGHGDLRPEHVCLLQPPVVIDCLEFNPQLRQADPFDELAYLGMECGMAGAPWIGPRLVSGCAAAMGDSPPAALLQLYTAYRALVRARLAMAHLLDTVPRLPDQWPPRASRYIACAMAALDALAGPADRAPVSAATPHGSR